MEPAKALIRTSKDGARPPFLWIPSLPAPRTALAEFATLEETTWWVMERKYEAETKQLYVD